jgi:single-strand DNA-binding protein
LEWAHAIAVSNSSIRGRSKEKAKQGKKNRKKIFLERSITMPNVNIVVLAGHLTRDVELKYTPNGTAVCNMGLAVNNRYKSGDEWIDQPCFVDITVWGKQAENCDQYLSKGSPALVEGRLNFRTWEDQDGNKRSKLDVVANKVQFLSSRSSKEEGISEEEIPF